jgi:2-desacetyl-2-hydroxyethyl bacteriochlorophyllide A dehydrogenase
VPDTRPMAFVTQPGVIEIWERPIPSLAELDVLIKVRATTLCGSDMHIFKGAHPSVTLPVPVGHEIAGEVARVGAGVTKVKPGDRVTVEPVITCNTCHYCRQGQYHLCANISFQYRQGQGGLTTDFVAPERWVHVLPAGIPYQVAALIEPLAVAVHAVGLSGLEIAESVAIFGAGAIGLLILQVARAAGAGQVFITDIRTARLEAALNLGASGAFNGAQADTLEQIRQQTGGLGVQRAFEAVGLEATLTQTLQSLQKGGSAVLVGLFESQQIHIPANIFVHKEISLTGSQGYHWDFQRAIELLGQDKIDLEKMLTHSYPLDQTQQAFEVLQDQEQNAIKVVISSP